MQYCLPSAKVAKALEHVELLPALPEVAVAADQIVGVGYVKDGEVLEDEADMGYARHAGLGDRFAEQLEAASGIDEGRVGLDGCCDVSRPVEPLHGPGVDGGQERQVRVEVVHVAQVLHGLEQLGHDLLAHAFARALEDARARPVRDLVEVFGEAREVGTRVLVLARRPHEQLGHIDAQEELLVDERHLTRQVDRAEVEHALAESVQAYADSVS